jgi:hypothetical protein
MPGLSTLLPFGDTSPLTRFVIGLDEALRDYRGTEETPLLRNIGRSNDPWNEDLFYRRLPVQPPILRQEGDLPANGSSPEAMMTVPHQNYVLDGPGAHARFGDNRCDEPGVSASSRAARILAGLMALAGPLADMLLTPARSGSDSRKTEKRRPAPAKATGDGE